jgi:chaperonin GroES
MKFKPLHDRVVVRRLEDEAKTAGGIIIPDTAKEKPMQGEIIAVGPGARDENGKLVPIDVRKGDRVLFGKWSGTEVKIDGDNLTLLRLLLGGVGDDDAALCLLLRLDTLHHHPVMQRAELEFCHDHPHRRSASGLRGCAESYIIRIT